MSHKYSIDELFREGLSEGREQLNLGAWANMDRMLNGQNPYTEDEQPTQRKKRRWLPLLLIGVLVTAIIGAGTYLLNNNKENNYEVAKTENKSQNTHSQNNTETNNTNKSFNIDLPEKSNPEVEKTDNLNNNKAYSKHRNNQIATEKNTTTQNVENTNETSILNDDEHVKTSNSETIKLNKNKKLHRESVAKTESKAENSKEEKADIKEQEISLENNKSEIEKKNKIKQTVKTIVTKEIVAKDEYNVNNTKVDTLSITQTEREKDNETNIALENKQEVKNENTNYHPRYIGAHIHVEGPQKESKRDVAVTNKQHNENDSNAKTEESKQNTIAKNEKGNESDWKNNITNTFAKVGEKTGDFFSAFKKLDLGISLGLSVALFGTQNNYGGFQGGITNATRISDNLTLLSELKFFLHNNAGFTINQIQTNVFNQSIDTATYAATHQTLYSYQIDSIVKKYNFKNFMSLQLPVMLQYTFNRFGIYAGANFAYNFKIQTTEVDNKYVKSYFAKIDNGTPYEFPTGTATDYARTDFRARFGVGYAVGFNCYINSKVYVDLRLAKQLWDNSNNNAMREISSGVTKVPFTQLSLGYKFGKKE